MPNFLKAAVDGYMAMQEARRKVRALKTLFKSYGTMQQRAEVADEELTVQLAREATAADGFLLAYGCGKVGDSLSARVKGLLEERERLKARIAAMDPENAEGCEAVPGEPPLAYVKAHPFWEVVNAVSFPGTHCLRLGVDRVGGVPMLKVQLEDGKWRPIVIGSGMCRPVKQCGTPLKWIDVRAKLIEMRRQTEAAAAESEPAQ